MNRRPLGCRVVRVVGEAQGLTKVQVSVSVDYVPKQPKATRLTNTYASNYVVSCLDPVRVFCNKFTNSSDLGLPASNLGTALARGAINI